MPTCRAEVVEWAAQEVFAATRNGEHFQGALHAARNPRAALNVVDEDEASAGTQDARHLRNGLDVVGDGAEPECTHNGVECVVVERQLLGVGLLQGGSAAEFG